MKKWLKIINQNESGWALVLTIALLGLGSLMLTPLLAYTGTGLETEVTFENKTEELYAADAGVEDAIWHINDYGVNLIFTQDIGGTPYTLIGLPPYVKDAAGNDLPSTWYTASYSIANVNEDKGVDIIIQWLDGIAYRIISTATSPDGSITEIEALIEPTFATDEVWNNAITALNGDINITGNFNATGTDGTDADVHANGNVDFNGKPDINGDVSATGTIDPGGANINGDTTEGAGVIEGPSINLNQYLAESEATGNIYEGNYNITGDPPQPLGPIHITGDLAIKGNATVLLGGTVYVDGKIRVAGGSEIVGGHTVVAVGDITLTGTSYLPLEDIPFIISVSGDIYVSGNDWTSAMIYAMDGDVYLSGSGSILGLVIGQSVTGVGSSNIEYPTELIGNLDLPPTLLGIGIRSWIID
ncbi:MAG: hypothetical protein JSV32_03120 [Dehalococcoidia bacterium]|nr:MAG: hypothetical protein JSV32_03120 [Dehalococcoidia bacterium]